MANQLVAGGARNAVDGEGEAGVLQHRVVARRYDLAEETLDLSGRQLLDELTGADFRVTQTSGSGDGKLRLWSISDQADSHRFSPMVVVVEGTAEGPLTRPSWDIIT